MLDASSPPSFTPLRRNNKGDYATQPGFAVGARVKVGNDTLAPVS
jgi:hypothetical protein